MQKEIGEGHRFDKPDHVAWRALNLSRGRIGKSLELWPEKGEKGLKGELRGPFWWWVGRPGCQEKSRGWRLSV